MQANAIRALLEGALKTALEAEDPDFAIAWPGREFTPTKGTPYARPTILPAETVAAACGDTAENLESGILAVDLFYPVGKGLGDGLELAEALGVAFKRGTRFSDETNGFDVVVRSVATRPTRVEPEWIQIPVFVNWYAYTPQPSGN